MDNFGTDFIESYQVMPGTSSHTKICLNGKGLKRVNAYGQGNHYVDLKITIPKSLSQEQKALLQVDKDIFSFVNFHPFSIANSPMKILTGVC